MASGLNTHTSFVDSLAACPDGMITLMVLSATDNLSARGSVVEAVPQARTGVPGVSFLMVLIANQLETAVRCGGHRVCLRMHTRQL